VLRVPLPELDVAKVRRYCRQRVPADALDQVRLEVEVTATAVTIVERRAPWRPEAGPEWTTFPIARIRYSPPTRRWTLYWRDRNLRFHRYESLGPSPSIDRVLDEITADPTAIFWG
jgi:hypothetical protein